MNIDIEELKRVIKKSSLLYKDEFLDKIFLALEQQQARIEDLESKRHNQDLFIFSLQKKITEKSSEWISVDDRLPDIIENCKGSIAGISDPIMVMFKDKGDANSFMGVSRLFKGGRGDLTSFHWDFDYPKVTHWKQLPKPPEGEL